MNDVIRRIESWNNGRLPDILPLKYKAMQENLFRFLRATNHIFYEDLAMDGKIPKGPLAWICGDLHLENFGTFRGDNGLVYFDLNDFDDAALAPVTWELTRMCVSIFAAFRSMNIEKQKAFHMSQLFLAKYADTLLKRKSDHVEANTAKGLICNFLDSVRKRKRKELLKRRTLNGRKMDKNHPGHLTLPDQQCSDLSAHVNNWLKKDDNSPYRYRVADCVFRLAGTSSLGLERYALLLGSENDEGSKKLIIDMKEAVHSSLYPVASGWQPKWSNNADRVLTLQRLMQDRSPALLSSSYFKGKYFIIQELQPVKDNLDFKMVSDYREMIEVITTLAVLTASAHLRAAGHFGADNGDSLAAFAKDKTWDRQILSWSEKYVTILADYYKAFSKWEYD